MKIREINISWKESQSIFSSPAFLSFYSNFYGYIGGFENNTLIMFLSYNKMYKSGFKYILLINDVVLLKKFIDDYQIKQFLNLFCDYFQNQSFDFIISNTAHSLYNVVPDNSLHVPFATYWINLKNSEETIWNNIQSRQKTVIRKVQKSSVEIRHGLRYSEKVYALIRETQARTKRQFMRIDDYNKLINIFNKHIEIFVAIKEGEIQGGAVIPYSKFCAWYLYGCSVSKPFPGSIKLLHWEAIKHFKRLGIKQYDFMGVRVNPKSGSKLEGIKQFKQRFGGEYRQAFIWKLPLRPWKYRLYKLALHVHFLVMHRKIYEGDVIDQEQKNK